MKLKNRNRSSLTINAVAQAAAQGAATALLPGRKLTAVAALAGFVLRLFRRSEGTTDAVRTECGAEAIPMRCRSDTDTIPARYWRNTAYALGGVAGARNRWEACASWRSSWRPGRLFQRRGEDFGPEGQRPCRGAVERSGSGDVGGGVMGRPGPWGDCASDEGVRRRYQRGRQVRPETLGRLFRRIERVRCLWAVGRVWPHIAAELEMAGPC